MAAVVATPMMQPVIAVPAVVPEAEPTIAPAAQAPKRRRRVVAAPGAEIPGEFAAAPATELPRKIRRGKVAAIQASEPLVAGDAEGQENGEEKPCQLVVHKAMREFVKRQGGMHCGSDIFDAMNNFVQRALSIAARRALANGRKTIKTDDL